MYMKIAGETTAYMKGNAACKSYPANYPPKKEGGIPPRAKRPYPAGRENQSPLPGKARINRLLEVDSQEGQILYSLDALLAVLQPVQG